MRTIIITLLVLNLVSYSAISQDFAFPDLAGYKKIQNYPVYRPENLWDFINGAADNYLAFGFIDLNVAEYKKGKNVIKVEIYRHKDHTMAFGIYSSERSPSFSFINLGAQGYKTDGVINFFKGDCYVKIRTYSTNEKVLQASESLAQRVSGIIEGDTRLPSALSMFPASGKKPNEEIFINESVLGHKFLDRAYRALYESGTDVFSVYILIRDTPEEAKGTVDKYLTTAGAETDGIEADKFMLRDGYNGTIFLARKDRIIVIISGLSGDQAALADRYTTDILK